MAIPRMRTAEKVLEEIKREDPETEVSLHYIRRLIKTGAVPVVACGRKKLVNVDDIQALLAQGYEIPEDNDNMAYGQIRRVV